MITSTSNPRVKFIRKLQHRKERQTTGLCYVEGLKGVGEACQQGAAIETMIVAPGLISSDFAMNLLQQQKDRGVEILELDDRVFTSLSLKERPKGLAAVVRQNWLSISQVTLSEAHLWVALEAVQDPGNLGTILRTSDAVGARGVILLDQCTDAYDPTSIRASMGAIFSQKLVRSDYDEFSTWLGKQSCLVVGASGESKIDYLDYTYKYPMILIMGSERQGLSKQYMELCNGVVSIPMQGRSDSLNLSVATAVVLYGIYNQKRILA